MFLLQEISENKAFFLTISIKFQKTFTVLNVFMQLLHNNLVLYWCLSFWKKICIFFIKNIDLDTNVNHLFFFTFLKTLLVFISKNAFTGVLFTNHITVFVHVFISVLVFLRRSLHELSTWSKNKVEFVCCLHFSQIPLCLISLVLFIQYHHFSAHQLDQFHFFNIHACNL